MQTITRKFLVKQTLDLTGKKQWSQTRYYLYRKNGIVIRIQTDGEKFELERKESKTDVMRESEKISITKEEFESIGKIAIDYVFRDSYFMSETPRIILRIYHGQFEGLVRAEIEFQSIEEANHFSPPQWMGKEITSTPLAKDETLLGLTVNELQRLL